MKEYKCTLKIGSSKPAASTLGKGEKGVKVNKKEKPGAKYSKLTKHAALMIKIHLLCAASSTKSYYFYSLFQEQFHFSMTHCTIYLLLRSSPSLPTPQQISLIHYFLSLGILSPLTLCIQQTDYTVSSNLPHGLHLADSTCSPLASFPTSVSAICSCIFIIAAVLHGSTLWCYQI